MARDDSSVAGALAEYLREHAGSVEEGLSSEELDAAQRHFRLAMPRLWRDVLQQVHPLSWADGRHAIPDWRLRDEDGTRGLIEWPIEGLLFDVEYNGFWWKAWGECPHGLKERLEVAGRHLRLAPRLTPLWVSLYVAPSAHSPVFSIHQSDLYVPALSLADLVGGVGEDELPTSGYPVGDVPFWSELHAWSQVGHLIEAVGDLATAGNNAG